MFYVTLNSARQVKMPEFLRELVESNDSYNIVQEEPVTVGCHEFEDVAGLVSAIDRTDMPISNIQVSGHRPLPRRLLDAASAN